MGDTYNPVTDNDCDGDTDCLDRSAFIANYPPVENNGVEDDGCP